MSHPPATKMPLPILDAGCISAAQTCIDRAGYVVRDVAGDHVHVISSTAPSTRGTTTNNNKPPGASSDVAHALWLIAHY